MKKFDYTLLIINLTSPLLHGIMIIEAKEKENNNEIFDYRM